MTTNYDEYKSWIESVFLRRFEPLRLITTNYDEYKS